MYRPNNKCPWGTKRTMEFKSPIYCGGKCKVSASVFLIDFERQTKFKEIQTPKKSCPGALSPASLLCCQGLTGN